MLSPVDPRDVLLDGGRHVCWEGMFTGHLVLTDAQVSDHAHQLLGVDRTKMSTLVEQMLLPHHSHAGATPPALVLHSTTPTLRAFEGDAAELAAGRDPHDTATYTESRAVYLAHTRDLCVGRTAPWREAVALRGVPAVDVGDTEHYYLSHALLVMARNHAQGQQTPLREVIDWLRQRPDAVVRLYALDVETQIFLLWLQRQAGVRSIAVEANSPTVSSRWNRKSHIHPSAAQVHDLPTAGIDVADVLRAEQRHSEAHRRLGMAVPVLPGYLISRAGVDVDAFVADVATAAALLRNRYGIELAALKPSEAGDGARIVGHLNLADDNRLSEAAREAHRYGDDYLLEAWVEFLTVKLGGSIQQVVPSGHFRQGQVAEGITLQSLDGFAWRGNTYLDEAAWTRLGLPSDAYQAIRDALKQVRQAFLGAASITDGSHEGLVLGGIDFAVGRVGGRFTDRTIVGAIDFNLSSHGAEYLRAFMDEARALDTPDDYGATHVFVPPAHTTLRTLERLAAEHTAPGGLVRAIACIPRRWAMIAATGPDPDSATTRVRTLIDTAST